MDYAILDCTLRDGGYYNNWDFDPDIVRQYLGAVSHAKIDYVELGLRNFAKTGFYGAFAYTTEEFLSTLNLPAGPDYGVMVDAKTILGSGLTVERAINALFIPAKDSKLGFVRVAAHFDEVDHCSAIVTCLRNLGYRVGFNLMQAGGKPSELLAEKSATVASWEVVEVLYFADSLGNMSGDEVQRIVSNLRLNWNGSLGIHAHNNMGRALDNTLVGFDTGVSWLDATVTGMGRGAGNTQTETLLAHLDKAGSKYISKPIFDLVIRHFEPMQKTYGWGSNLLYYLGAQNDIHPSYIQNILSNSCFGTDEIIGAIGYLSRLDGASTYSSKIFNSALSCFDNGFDVTGSEDVQGLFDGKDILIIANAPNTEKYAAAIEMYVKNTKPLVISLNINKHISPNLIDFYAISHNSKFLSESHLYMRLDKPIILPRCRFTADELNVLKGVRILDYGLSIEKNVFEIFGTHTITPFDTTSAYILGVLTESNVSQICVAGFDGYPQHDRRQEEMVETLTLYNKHPNSVEIKSLTPTSYPIIKSSVYAPII